MNFPNPRAEELLRMIVSHEMPDAQMEHLLDEDQRAEEITAGERKDLRYVLQMVQKVPAQA